MNQIKRVLSFMLLFFLALNLSSQDMHNTSQKQDNNDSIITGKKYRIILFNNKEIIGRVTKQDSLQIQLKSDNSVYQFKREDIFEISSELTPSKLKAILWAGGGLCLLGGGTFNEGYDDENKNGFTMQLSGMYPFSETGGIRFDLSFSQTKSIPGSVYYDPYSYYSEQTIRSYYIRANYVFGTFSPSDKFKIYGFPGIGINMWDESEYTYYSSYENQNYTYTNPGFNYSSLLLSAGFGAGYMVSKKIGFYGEAEYNLSIAYERGRGYFLAKGGIIFNVF